MWRRSKHRRGRKHQGNDEPVGLGLDEVLAALSQDLVHASEGTLTRGGGYGLGVERAEVELSVTVVKGINGTGDVTTNVRVLPWGMSAGITGHSEISRQNSYIHRVTLALIPVVADNIPGTPPEPASLTLPQEAEADRSVWGAYRTHRQMINANTEELGHDYVSPAYAPVPPAYEPHAPAYTPVPPAYEPYAPGTVSPVGNPVRRETYSPGTGRPVAEGLPTIRTDVQAKKDKE